MSIVKEKVIELINKELEENYELINDEKNYHHDDILAVKIQTNFLTEMLLEVEKIPDSETTNKAEPEPKITRFEYITDKGREVVEYGEFTYSIQDDGRTLKVFKENKTNK